MGLWCAVVAMGMAACTLRMMRRPFQHLHPAHRAARHAEQLVDAQVVDQLDLRAHHVADGDDREVQAVGFARGRVDGQGPVEP
jgi:hypothetical protein